jgi:predicted amidohydrolase
MTRARIATICRAAHYYPTVAQNRAHVLQLLDLALQQAPDLVCLPETFTTVSVPVQNIIKAAETVPGPTTKAVARRAREHGCYVICPIKNVREGTLWNSAVLIDRHGEIVGLYDKAQPVTSSFDYTVFESGVQPGAADVPVFDLDFGRIGIQICFDAGFPETWQRLSDKGAQVVFWPSAYNGGFPLQVYAYLHHYYVVSSVRTDSARIVDPLGQVLHRTDERHNVIYRDINLDYCVCHYDFNHSIPDQIMAACGSGVEIRSDRDSGHFLVEPRDDALTIVQLQAMFGFEPTRQYHQRHRDAYAQMHDGSPARRQQAAHGDRPMHAKW